MANTVFVPPANMEFNIGSIEQKMEMTLDEIIKMSKKPKKQRVPIKSRRNRKVNARLSKAALQKSVVSRSSALRQGKFAEARARGGGARFAATQAAAKRALSTPIATRMKHWAIIRNELKRLPLTTSKGPNKVDPSAPTWRPHTLDSLFANMKKQRMEARRFNI